MTSNQVTKTHHLENEQQNQLSQKSNQYLIENLTEN